MKTALTLPTMEIFEEEPAFMLTEVNLQSPGNQGFHRYQVLWVMRGDNLHRASIDLGPRHLYEADQFRIPGAVETLPGKWDILHNVVELREIADVLRDEKSHAAQIEPSPLGDYIGRISEERRSALVKKGTFGKYAAITRS